MNENIKKLLEKVAQDPELSAKMRAIQDPDEAYKVASSLQDGFTKEEFLNAMKELAVASGDLSDDDLKKFAGGGGSMDVSLVTSIVSVSAGAAAEAAAI